LGCDHTLWETAARRRRSCGDELYLCSVIAG
jgi:hypothetical protein